MDSHQQVDSNSNCRKLPGELKRTNSASSSKNLIRLTSKSQSRNQLSSFVLFISVIIIVNLCPFEPQPERTSTDDPASTGMLRPNSAEQVHQALSSLLSHVQTSVNFMTLMFTNPIKLGQRNLRFTMAEAKVIGKMAKVWFIKKKIKKLSKKLKKHTIAVPVFTAIPIYEHSY